MNFNSLEMWSFELMVLLSGLLPDPTLQTSVLSIWLVLNFDDLFTDDLLNLLDSC
jgi:hypothetical protein